jgi:putative membrane protein
MKISKSLLAAALAAVSVSALAADAEKMAPTPAMFVSEAAQAGMAEVALGKVALDKSKDAQVRTFAERMVADHGKANDELAALASTKGIDVPKKLDAKHEALVTAMKGKDGADFDRAYSQHMKMDHSKAVELFESEAKSSDAEFAGFASKTLPTLREHKQMAAKLPVGKAS